MEEDYGNLEYGPTFDYEHGEPDAVQVDDEGGMEVERDKSKNAARKHFEDLANRLSAENRNDLYRLMKDFELKDDDEILVYLYLSGFVSKVYEEVPEASRKASEALIKAFDNRIKALEQSHAPFVKALEGTSSILKENLEVLNSKRGLERLEKIEKVLAKVCKERETENVRASIDWKSIWFPVTTCVILGNGLFLLLHKFFMM